MIEIMIGRKDFTGLFKKIQERAGRISTNKAAVWNVLKSKLDKYAQNRTERYEINKTIEPVNNQFHMEYIVYNLYFINDNIEEEEYKEMQQLFQEFKYGEKESKTREETAKEWYKGLGKAGKIAQNILNKTAQSVAKGLKTQTYDEILLKKFEIVVEVKKK